MSSTGAAVIRMYPARFRDRQRTPTRRGSSEDTALVREPALPEHLHVLEERERARRRDLLDERVFSDAERARLVAQERVIVADAVGDLEVVRGEERDPLVAARHRDRPDNLQILARRLQPLHARL